MPALSTLPRAGGTYWLVGVGSRMGTVSDEADRRHRASWVLKFRPSCAVCCKPSLYACLQRALHQTIVYLLHTNASFRQGLFGGGYTEGKENKQKRQKKPEQSHKATEAVTGSAKYTHSVATLRPGPQRVDLRGFLSLGNRSWHRRSRNRYAREGLT